MSAKQNIEMILGVQSWSIRKQLEKDPILTLEKLSNLGFSYIETTDLEEAKQLNTYASHFGITIKSSFLYWLHITDNWHLDESIDYPWPAKKTDLSELASQCVSLGLSHVSLGYISSYEREVDSLKRIVDRLNIASDVFNSFGLTLSYHNHSFEFEDKNEFIFFDYLIQNTDSDKVRLEVDTMWCHVVGIDTQKFLTNHAEKIEIIHLKNLKPEFPKVFDDAKMPKQFFTSLDKGVIPMNTLITKARDLGIQHFYLEQDYSDAIFDDLSKGLQLFNEN